MLLNNTHLLRIPWFLKVIMPSSKKKGHCTERFAHVWYLLWHPAADSEHSKVQALSSCKVLSPEVGAPLLYIEMVQIKNG